METGIEIISKERKRQIDIEGWDHDEEHVNGELYVAALYALTVDPNYKQDWGFEKNIMIEKFENEKECLIHRYKVAGALLAAEIDRLQATE